ncbi:ribulose bisphosphate carboxylase small subunit, chloroplastic-like isoform X2 [Euphorbia lathyris]|uniref:ribulose bisphosphate carboxylase small subunit, chloroplastic-like isoform X2 n=1 Tax=Euphorbia lathyris TaxID=212925 RepID=UPI003313EBEB
MASSMLSTATVASINRASPAQATMVAPFTGLKSSSAFPSTRKSPSDITSVSNNGGRVQCMQVWPTQNMKKFETLSYLPPLSRESLMKEVQYLLRKGWIPCLEFEVDVCTVRTTNPQDTMTDTTGPCGSYPCSVAATPHRC